MRTDDDYFKHRYEEWGDMFSLRSWRSTDRHGERDFTIGGKLKDPYDRPLWLESIVHVAIIGGHVKRAPTGPHHAIVWFRTDENHNFIDFIDFTTKA